MENSSDKNEILKNLLKANDEFVEIVNVYRSIFELIGDKAQEELTNSLSCRASRGICLNEIRQIALTIVGKYDDEEFDGIY